MISSEIILCIFLLVISISCLTSNSDVTGSGGGYCYIDPTGEYEYEGQCGEGRCKDVAVVGSSSFCVCNSEYIRGAQCSVGGGICTNDSDCFQGSCEHVRVRDTSFGDYEFYTRFTYQNICVCNSSAVGIRGSACNKCPALRKYDQVLRSCVPNEIAILALFLGIMVPMGFFCFCCLCCLCCPIFFTLAPSSLGLSISSLISFVYGTRTKKLDHEKRFLKFGRGLIMMLVCYFHCCALFVVVSFLICFIIFCTTVLTSGAGSIPDSLFSLLILIFCFLCCILPVFVSIPFFCVQCGIVCQIVLCPQSKGIEELGMLGNQEEEEEGEDELELLDEDNMDRFDIEKEVEDQGIFDDIKT